MRFVRSIKDECLDRLIFFGERSLRRATREFAAHYHQERNHQGLGNQLVEPNDRLDTNFGAVDCLQRLGGLLRFYHRAAAESGSRDTRLSQPPVGRESGQHGIATWRGSFAKRPLLHPPQRPGDDATATRAHLLRGSALRGSNFPCRGTADTCQIRRRPCTSEFDSGKYVPLPNRPPV